MEEFKVVLQMPLKDVYYRGRDLHSMPALEVVKDGEVLWLPEGFAPEYPTVRYAWLSPRSRELQRTPTGVLPTDEFVNRTVLTIKKNLRNGLYVATITLADIQQTARTVAAAMSTMTTFEIHPHFGYLNSDICLINRGNTLLVVRDVEEGKEYRISALSIVVARFSAGKHTFVDTSDDSALESIMVEDAIKLGGSKEKKTYVFEGTPWILMVMLDRTYFYHRETREQYIEHGLAPENIQFLTHKYLLFITDKDNSLFSLDNLSVEKTVGEANFIYSNAHYAVFSSSDGLILYSLDEDVDTRLISLCCNDYAIDKSNQILYYHIENSRDVLFKPLNDANAKESLFQLTEPFRCFIGDYSVISGISPQSLSVMNLRSRESTKLYEDILPVITINGKVIWENNASDKIDEKDVANSFTSYAELTVYERQDRWLFIAKTKYVLKNCGVVSCMVKYLFRSTTVETVLQSDQPMIITEGKAFDYVKENTNKGFLIFKNSFREFKGEPIVSPSGYILIATEDNILIDPMVPSFRHPYNGNETWSLFSKTGLIKVVTHVEEGVEQIEFRDVENNQTFANTFYADLGEGGFYRLSGGRDDFIHSNNGIVRAMPCVRDRLIAISEQCNYAIVRSEEGVVIYAYDLATKAWSGTPLGNMIIDKSFYSKAVFCSDGENIIYQKTGNQFFLRHIGSDEETEFTPQNSIVRRNINGYIPYLDFDTHRRPVYVDPVSLTRIEAAAARQFTYQSVDGRITHVDHNVVKYYSYEKEQYVSSDEYKSYVTKYDYETAAFFNLSKRKGPDYERAMENRKLYYNLNKNWLKDLTLESFLDVDSVCNNYIFRREYYVRERVDGEILDIRLPNALYFLNYVSYSYDNRYIIIAGRFPPGLTHKGLAMVYDVRERKIEYQSTSTKAVWLGVFSKKGMVAYYDSVPNSFFSEESGKCESFIEIKGRSFLAFSPSGKYIAMSRQGYIPYCSGEPHWGHQPSCDVYIVGSKALHLELAHFCDHGDQIEGYGRWDRTNASVASATFSKDDKKLMTVSKDGVVVVRNLHFDEREETDI